MKCHLCTDGTKSGNWVHDDEDRRILMNHIAISTVGVSPAGVIRTHSGNQRGIANAGNRLHIVQQPDHRSYADLLFISMGKWRRI